MEEMKNLVIQTLETKGILGQIRAKLRSAVFKVVDDQDNRMNSQPSGCGLKWENPNLYKIKETSIGGLTAEMIREYMEYFRMDYSLSVFIPECSISPERIKKDELHARLGLNVSGFNSDFPFIYFIIHYFMESIQANPEKVYESLNKIGGNVEKLSDDIVTRNYYNYQANLMNEEDMQMNPTEENNTKNNMNEMDANNSYTDSNRNHKINNYTNNNSNSHIDKNVTNNIQNETVKTKLKENKGEYEFEKLNVEDYGNVKKYYDLDDIVRLFYVIIKRTTNIENKLNNFENNINKLEKKPKTIMNIDNIPVVEKSNDRTVNQIPNEES